MDIPNTFDNYEQRMLSAGLETKSFTEYNDYIIVLRCYTGSGISAKIMKVLESGKYVNLRQESWNYYIPLDLLNRMKNYIDNYEINLINSLNKKLIAKPNLLTK